jgi:3-oxoacyl-[acyl-carrier protein] reductase
MLNISLKSKNALIIGGSRGIGAAIVKKCAEAGSNVAWTHSGSPKGENASKELSGELKKHNVNNIFKGMDCCDSVSLDDFALEIAETWGGVDYFVYNAGFTSPCSMLEISEEDWKRTVDINLNGAFISLKSVLNIMLKKNKGSIVFIGSAAVPAGGGGRADYVSAKAGLEALAKATTKEFSPKGIRCNVVHPSLIETDLLKQRHPLESKRDELGSQVPMGRLGQPEDIANLTVFLLSDMASYITAQNIFVDGGRTFCK